MSPATFTEFGARRVHGLPGRLAAAAAAASIAGAYFASAKLGLDLSVADSVITPVWPTAGIALASLLLFGVRLWPAIAIGALLSNLTHDVPLGAATAVAVGNTLEAVAAYALLRRAQFRLALDRVRDVVALVLATFIAAAVAATIGVTALAIAGVDAASPYGTGWATWWLGDAMGILLVAPAILVWGSHRGWQPSRARTVEALALPALIAGASATLYFGGFWRYPYPLFPLLVWATIRFRQHGAATGSFVVAATAVAGAVSGHTPIGDSAATSAGVVQALLAFVAVSLLVLGATLAESDAAEVELRETGVSLAEAQELSNVGSWEWDIATGRIAWSAAMLRMFGVEQDGKPPDFEGFLELVRPRDRDAVRRAFDTSLRTRQPFELTYGIVLEGGEERVLHARGRVVGGEHGRPLRLAGTSQDVTERHHLETLRENILAAVSHELRTPLASIVGFALTLEQREKQLDDGTRREIVHELTQQSLRLQRLLSDLLDVDRLRHGRLRLDLAPVDVTELARYAAAAVGPMDGSTIVVHGDPVVADVDRVKLERVIENLIGNAVTHTPPGSHVDVTVAAEPRGVLIRVDDDGTGVPDPQKQSIFDLFARGGDPNAPGTGIGLALVAQFVALQGGRVWVEDNASGGASFRVFLPARVDDRAPA